MNPRTLHSDIRADRAANRGNQKSVLVLRGYRWARWFVVRRKSAPVLWALGLPCQVAYRVLVEWVLGVELPAKADAGPGLVLWHGQGLVVHADTKLGAGVVLRQNTTIGPKARDGVKSAAPVLEDGVDVGANSVIIGAVRIGAGAVVGAGSVVTRDVAPGAVVAGNPAREIEPAGERE